MPKTKPTKTESLRIELQQTERDQLDKIANSIAFRNYMKPLVDAASDNTIFYIVIVPILSLIAASIGLAWTYRAGLLDTPLDVFKDFMDTYESAKEAGIVPAISTALAGGILPGFLGNVAKNNPQEFAQVLDSIDVVGIATDPSTYIDPILNLRPENPLGIDNVVDDFSTIFGAISRLFD